MTAIIEAAALVRRLEAAADILKRCPCEVYGLEKDCRDAAAIIPLIRAAALEEAVKVAEEISPEVFQTPSDIAAIIRALKPPSPSPSDASA
jgi:hypothetical protein